MRVYVYPINQVITLIYVDADDIIANSAVQLQEALHNWYEALSISGIKINASQMMTGKRYDVDLQIGG